MTPEPGSVPVVNPPARLLMGPGPINADPRVLRAMSAPLIGQFDPAMTGYMNETMALYRGVFRTGNSQTFLVDGTSRAGIEAALVSLVSPGDRVLVPIFGRFGHLLVEIAERVGADVHTIEVPWGEVFAPEQIEAAVIATRPSLLAVVHGDTSTTMAQPLGDLGEICRRHGVLLYTDVTATLGGNVVAIDDWGVDAATAGLQKCMAGPAGSAPITLSPAAVDVIRARSSVEAGIRSADSALVADPAARIRSNYFDLAMLMDYWGPARLNHHTEATSMLYAAHECARILLEEGIDAAVRRHQLSGDALAAGLSAMGLGLYGDQRHRMNNVVGVVIPEGINGEAVRTSLLTDFGIEIGTSFGPLAGVIWRIGSMGYNARRDAVLTTLVALESVLLRRGHRASPGAALEAATDVLS